MAGLTHRFMDAAFASIDADGSGTLQLGELRDAGFDHAVISQLDSGGDGQLSRAEFVDAVVARAFPKHGDATDRPDALLSTVQRTVAAVLERRHAPFGYSGGNVEREPLGGNR